MSSIPASARVRIENKGTITPAMRAISGRLFMAAGRRLAGLRLPGLARRA
jgi:hypothetical protein